MNIKNKILISFILFILLIFSFITISHASDEVSYPSYFSGYQVNMVLSYRTVNGGSGNFIVFLSDEGIVRSNGYNGYYKYDSISGNNFYYKEFSITAFDYKNCNSSIDELYVYYLNKLNDCSLSDFSLLNSRQTYCKETHDTSDNNSMYTVYYYGNSDIYDIDGNLVFQAPQVNRVVIPAIQQTKEIPQAMGQVMRILIPIGLIVFSIGFVIFLTRLIISRLT